MPPRLEVSTNDLKSKTTGSAIQPRNWVLKDVDVGGGWFVVKKVNIWAFKAGRIIAHVPCLAIY